jgi:hypothetical protein
MALEVGVNSYVSLDEAEAYFADRINVGSWTEADDLTKEQALVTAAKQLNLTRWIGVIADKSQTLAFPRIGSYYEPLYNDVVELDGTIVPVRISTANMEQAYHLINNDDVLDSSGSPNRIKVDVIEIEGLQSGAARIPVMSNTVSDLITPLMYESGMTGYGSGRPAGAWWRAN